MNRDRAKKMTAPVIADARYALELATGPVVNLCDLDELADRLAIRELPPRRFVGPKPSAAEREWREKYAALLDIASRLVIRARRGPADFDELEEASRDIDRLEERVDAILEDWPNV